MCGIAGYVGKGEPSLAMKFAFFTMASEMDDRGGHSWGWTDWEHVVKGLKLVRDGLKTEHLDHRSAAIHTRFGTTGAKVADNSHPFVIAATDSPLEKDVVVGMHNGIVYNHTELNRAYRRKCEVDSMHIFHHIADGVDLSTIEAYGTIIYRKGEALYGGRFNGGELSIALTNEGLLFASTEYAIERAIELSGLELVHFYEVVEGDLYRLEYDNLYVTPEKINISASTSKLTWDYFKNHQEEWWKDTDSSDFSSGKARPNLNHGGRGSLALDWELDMRDLDATGRESDMEVELAGEEPTGYTDEYNECEMCQYFGTPDQIYYHRLDNALVCQDCAYEYYGYVAPDAVDITPRIRFTCEECGLVKDGTTKEAKHQVVQDGKVLCPKCFYMNHKCKDLVMLEQKKPVKV